MRCPSCGTENAPDSRFCGGCGARLSASNQRVAPTHKITDDAPFPQRPPAAATPITAVGVGGPRPAPIAKHGARPASGLVAVPTVRAITPLPDIALGHVPSTQPYSGAPANIANIATPVPPTARPRATPDAPMHDLAMHDAPSRSLPIAVRRPWGRIALVLVIDIALAAGGVYLLREGLAGAQSSRTGAPASPRPQ